jgi:hypothetical protein
MLARAYAMAGVVVVAARERLSGLARLAGRETSRFGEGLLYSTEQVVLVAVESPRLGPVALQRPPNELTVVAIRHPEGETARVEDDTVD